MGVIMDYDAFSRAMGGLIRHKLHITRSADAEVATRHHHVGGLSAIADCAVVDLGKEFLSNRFLVCAADVCESKAYPRAA